jgi:lysophospholipase L1-like esterase
LLLLFLSSSSFPLHKISPASNLQVLVNAYFHSPQLSNAWIDDGVFGVERRAIGPRSIADRVPLRILCLGASITYGYKSIDGNGYRYALRGKLVADGNDVNMIGYVKAGNMSDNNVEAWPGLRIGQVAGSGNLSLPEMPNVVLIFLGTNDMTQNFQIATAHLRMGSLISQILSKVPNATVIVGKLLPNAKPSAENNTLIFNANLDSVVANFTAQRKKVSSVDMHSDWFSLADIGPDGTHPTNEGYLKMSRVFYKGIVAAAAAGNITAPVQVAGVDDYTAGNDSSKAGTAMDVVCQGAMNSTAGKIQCSDGGRSEIFSVSRSLFERVVCVNTYDVIDGHASSVAGCEYIRHSVNRLMNHEIKDQLLRYSIRLLR